MNIDAIYARARAAFEPKRPDLIQRGNVDIALTSTWRPAEIQPHATDLPIYPSPVDLFVEVVR